MQVHVQIKLLNHRLSKICEINDKILCSPCFFFLRYYFLRSVKVKIPGSVAKMITTMQILQFVISIAILSIAGYQMIVNKVMFFLFTPNSQANQYFPRSPQNLEKMLDEEVDLICYVKTFRHTENCCSCDEIRGKHNLRRFIIIRTRCISVNVCFD